MARIACSPITWTGTLYENVLDDVAGAGYAGVEAHVAEIEAHSRQPARLRALLDVRQLALSSVPFTGWYFDRELWPEERERLRRLTDFAAEVGGEGTIVVFRTVPNPARRDMVAGHPPLLPLDANRLERLSDVLNRYCDVCAGAGLRGALANRVGTFIETPDELEAVAERTEASLVWLAPDLGHWAYAGGDPAALVRVHRDRIVYPRLKGFDQAVFEHTREERLGVGAFVHNGGFTELGAGTVDLEQVLQPLLGAEYDGWLCVEIELTTSTPRESATISRDFLRQRLHW